MIETPCIRDLVGIIRDHDLGRVVRWVYENNPSQSLPYHNLDHCLRVMYYADKIWQHDLSAGVDLPADLLGKDTPNDILVAALFHDFDHGGGFFVENDRKNIERAIHGFLHYNTSHTNPKYQYHRELVPAFIADTEYPYRDRFSCDKHGNSFESRAYRQVVYCLRDADMMGFVDNMQIPNLVAMKAESFRYNTWSEFIAKQLDWLNTIEFKTMYGQKYGTEARREAWIWLQQLEMSVFD